MYQDTDSVVFLGRPRDWEPPIGDYLGELTDEIDPKDGNYIFTFVCPADEKITPTRWIPVKSS